MEGRPLHFIPLIRDFNLSLWGLTESNGDYERQAY